MYPAMLVIVHKEIYVVVNFNHNIGAGYQQD